MVPNIDVPLDRQTPKPVFPAVDKTRSQTVAIMLAGGQHGLGLVLGGQVSSKEGRMARR